MGLSLYWHDYETWGADPSRDRAVQFAGIRTDLDLNIIGEPLVMFSKPTADLLPHPDACLVTGITPQKAFAEGLPEYEFIRRIHDELAEPGTCTVGYNSIRFDDEVTRYTLYRNFYDPYAREWQNGNSRWDIIDMVRLTYALRPEGIEWPLNAEGKPSFRLEELTKANGLSHESAHDALSDVHATIALAKLIKDKQPKLYDYVFKHRNKKMVADLIKLNDPKPVLHISSMFPADRGCCALVLPIVEHPTNKNAVLTFDLSHSPDDLISLDVEAIRARIFVRNEDLPDGVSRIPLKAIHLNKCPIVATPRLLDDASAQRLGIDVASCLSNWQKIKTSGACALKVSKVFADQSFTPIKDPERMLYSGGFTSKHDKDVFETVRNASAEDLARQSFSFRDKRFPDMLFRYRARNFPESLNEMEAQEWHEFCQDRITNPDAETSIDLHSFQQRIDELMEAGDLSPEQEGVLYQLLDWGDALLG